MKCKGELKEYQVIGRKLPSAMEPNPKLYKMQILAPHNVAAKSRFWYFVSFYKKITKLLVKLLNVKKSTKNTQDALKTTASGSDTTVEVQQKTCTENIETQLYQELSLKCIEIRV